MDALRRLDYPRSQQPKLLVLSFPHNPTTVCVEKSSSRRPSRSRASAAI